MRQRRSENMGRIRSIKPEYTTDAKVSQLSLLSVATFPMIWCHADDEGRFEADPEIMKGLIWPRRKDVTPEMLRGVLDELAAGGFVQVYQVGDNVYGHVVNFRRHQKINRPSAARFPSPDDGEPAAASIQQPPPLPLFGGEDKPTKQGHKAKAKTNAWAMWVDVNRQVGKRDPLALGPDTNAARHLLAAVKDPDRLKELYIAYLSDNSHFLVSRGHSLRFLQSSANGYLAEIDKKLNAERREQSSAEAQQAELARAREAHAKLTPEERATAKQKADAVRKLIGA